MPRSALVAGLAAALVAVAAGCSSDDGGTSGAPQQAQVFVVGADGKGLRRLTREPDSHGRPEWSPDGVRIASATSRAIEVVEVGSGLQRAIPGRFGPGPIAWDAEGRELSVVVSELRAGVSLARVRHDGSRLRKTASLRELPGSDAAWSPGGRKLAFRSTRPPGPGAQPTQDLVSIGIDGRDRRVLARGRSWVGEPAWSFDGKRLAFATAPEGGPLELRLVGAGGGKDQSLLRGTGSAIVSWSRSGRSLAVGARPGKGRVAPGLYVLRLPGGARQRLAQATGNSAWSPDDRTIAYASGDRVETVRPDGRSPRTVVRIPGANVAYVAWSPSGREIAFTAVARPQSTPGPPPPGTR